MSRLVFSLPLAIALLSSGDVFAISADTLRPNYSDSIKYIVKHIATIKDSEIIEYCIPTTAAESRIYFSLDYEKAFSQGFRDLQYKLTRYCISGNTKLLKKYLYLSEYVDEYFADTYVAAIDKIAKANIISFCNVIADCEPERIKNLSEIKKDYCK